MAEPASNKTAAPPLHICPSCQSSLVQPTGWEQGSDRSSWCVWRRCPECEWFCKSVHTAVEIDAYDEQLDLGAHELATELRSLEHANMSEMASTFAAALANDLIGADDFA
ncbi:MAG TPA: hypothetical protein VI039_07385 [Solirubrobacterales bacterium]